MNTQNLRNAEAQAFAAKQAAFRVYAEAVGTESETEACQAYAIAFRDYAIALDAWMAGAKGGALQAYLATEDADRDVARNWASADAFNDAFAEYRTQFATA